MGVVVAGGGCASDAPVDVAGSYTVATTNGANGCQFPNWTQGATATGIALTVGQTGSDFNAVIGGVTGVFVDLWLGSHTFIGTVAGTNLHAGLAGERDQMPGTCKYRVNATMDGTLLGDALTGTIDLTTAIVTAASDCPPPDCHSIIAFNGTRPPR
jgi:hypothetical protein